MRFLKTILVTALIAGGAGLLAACGGAGEPPAREGATATPKSTANPAPDQDPIPNDTLLPTAQATSAPARPTSTTELESLATATPTPAGAPTGGTSTPTSTPRIPDPETPVAPATFTPSPPTFTPVPTEIPPSCSHKSLGFSDPAGGISIDLSGNSIARFRVREQFVRVSLPNDAVGKTRDVSGSLVFDGSGTVVAGQSKITVGQLSLQSDEDDRDEFLRTNSLESEKFPLAELVVRETPGMPWPIPCQGEALFQIAGDMTVHGVTVPLTWDATVQFRPDGAKGLMTINFPFSTFDMKIPKRLFLLSVDDNIRLELQFDAPITAIP